MHRALAVLGDHDEAARGRGAVGGTWQPDVDTEGFHVVIENASELVVTDLADVGGRPSEVGKPGDRVCHGAARHLGRRAHAAVEFVCLVLVD